MKEIESNQKQKNENKLSFTHEEKKLIKKYIEEYNDIYQKILILSPNDFFKKLLKHIELSLNSKKNKYSKQSREKVQEFILEKIYRDDYKYAQKIKNIIKERNNFELAKNYFKGEIIPHCDKDKKNGFYIHTCGERFQSFKYKLSYDYYIMNFDNENKSKDINTNRYETILFCQKCNMIYKSSLIKFRCEKTGIDFYSKINTINDEDDENDLPFATWSKYHCNVVINDLMKCQKCSNNLYLFKKNVNNEIKKYIFCKKCNQMWSPEQIKWICLICKKKFSSDAKIYNPLEYKTLKICVKEALVDRIKAIPKYLDCSCQIDFLKTNFFHRASCHGQLYFGELNGKKTVICSKCDSIGFYDGYVWTCPICLKKTKNILRENKFENEEKINKNIENNKLENKSVINGRGSEKFKDKDITDVKDFRENISLSKFSKEKNSKTKKIFNLLRNHLNIKEETFFTDVNRNVISNNYKRKKTKSILNKEKEINNSIETSSIIKSLKNTERIKDKSMNLNENKNENEDKYNNKNINFKKFNNNNINYEFNKSRNKEEEYFKNFNKRYITNLSISTKLKNDSDFNKNNCSLKKMNTNFGKLLSNIATRKNSKNINEKKNDKSFNINDNCKDTKLNNQKKSLSIIDLRNSNLEKVLNKFETQINNNLKSTAINFYKPSQKQILNKPILTNENRDKEISTSRNMKSINDLKTEESQIINKKDYFGEKMNRKDSFISKFNRFKKDAEISKFSSNKFIDKHNSNLSKNILNNRNILESSSNIDNSEITIRKAPMKEERISYLKKKKIFLRYKNANYLNNINNDNKSFNKIKNENKNNNIEKKNKEERESKINNYFSEYYNNKKRSNSTEADSDNAIKNVYHGKNPRQSLNIKKSKERNSNNNFFNINDYKIVKKIGQGSFGQIFEIEDKYQNRYALKKLIVNSEKDIKKIEHEYQILIDLDLNSLKTKKTLNLIKIYGFSSKQLDPTTNVIYVLMELAITDWEKEILNRQKNKKYYSEKELMTILSSLINTFADLQKQNVSHRDIKPQNILIFKDNKYKLADFGEAKELYKDIAPTNKQTLRGTELYMAPSLFHALRSKKVIKYINHNPYKSDVFSFGLCSLFAATLCFESIYDIRELNNNFSIHIILEKYLSKIYSFDVINVISHMLDINEITRKDFIEMQNEFKSIGYV